MIHAFRCTLLGCLTLFAAPAAGADDAAALRLVPFPKEVRLEPGRFDLKQPLVLEVCGPQGEFFARELNRELARAGLPAARFRAVEGTTPVFRLAAKPAAVAARSKVRQGTEENYCLEVGPEQASCDAPSSAGLFYGLQTLCQLIRANRRNGSIPCLSAADWPSLRWRCFQDDMTRGPSSTLATLRFEADLGAHLKLNLMTFYMEYQYAFKKHPKIGPKDGSLTPEDLAVLVEHVKPLHLGVLGNQQSFGHFSMILRHPDYAALRETGDVLSPVKEETYKLLDDMYSEVCPLLPFPFFNVCCDETYGLGTGPSKELAGKIGVGGVYVQHIRRIHDLLREKHKKRMMMWGDIILQHPEHLDTIPKDTIMLTWGYDPRPNFESQIIPFAKSGYEFFVCPGVNNWSRILPDFEAASTNIRNFVRDGVKHGAIGMLNTDWEDDGEAINAVKWHADAWAAECAWNAAVTPPEVFNRRVGAVLFGEQGDHFGKAVELLGKTHRMNGMRGMLNARFWDHDFPPQFSPATVQATAGRLLAAVRPAIEHLEACRKEAVANQHVLDAYLFGARRMEWIGQRMLDGLEAAQLYAKAYDASVGQAGAPGPKADGAAALLTKAEGLVRKNRDSLESFGKQFAALWLAESKPYALDWTSNRYDATVKLYDGLLRKLAAARKAAEAGKPLPRPDEVGLLVPEAFARRARPHHVLQAPLAPETPWAEPSAAARVGLLVRAGSTDRVDLPIEVEIALPTDLASKPVRAFCSTPGGASQEVLAQLDPSDQPGKSRLAAILPGPLPKGAQATLLVYLGLPAAAKPLPQAVATRDAPKGMKWIENDKVRLLLGPEGSHVYRWEVKAAGNRDLTEPGEAGWAGFGDLGSHRSVAYRLTCVAKGPALVRYQCVEPEGQVKTLSFYGGVSWMETVFNDTVTAFWNFDDPKNFAADGPTPGTYLFSNGATGPVGKQADGVAAQVEGPGSLWGIKFNKEKLALGMATPETACLHHAAPGSGAGGVGIEHSQPASHFVTFAGLLEHEPGETMNRLCRTLDLRNQPEVVLHAVQAKR